MENREKINTRKENDETLSKEKLSEGNYVTSANFTPTLGKPRVGNPEDATTNEVGGKIYFEKTQ